MSSVDSYILNKFLSQGAVISLNENEILIAWGDPLINASHNQSVPVFYLSEFFEEKGKWLQFSEHMVVTKSLFLESLKQVNKRSESIKRIWSEPDKIEFQNYFDRFQQDCALEKLKKVVPVVFAKSEGTFSAKEKLKSLTHLLETSNDLWIYGLWTNQYGFLGATPEILIDRIQNSFKTMALAGTSVKEGPNLLEDQKEKSEHQFVIDDINYKLKGCDLHWSRTEEWKVGNLKHLRTWAKGESEEQLESLISKLHPTSALGLTSGELNFSHLKNYCEASTRKFFGSPFGVKYGCRDLILVALRNIQWFNESSYIGSGCGLVAESELEKEWNELKLKREFTKEFLNL
ncbi:MAG: chorismate-binding protein [Bdellovibrionales bacterium]|nr:chorismate-binding protein [Bdellovibrionales bacterium]